LYGRLPVTVQREADEAYRLWRQDPSLPGLDFKHIHPAHLGILSARVSGNYRVIGYELPNGDIVWDWIGTHSEYLKLRP